MRRWLSKSEDDENSQGWWKPRQQRTFPPECCHWRASVSSDPSLRVVMQLWRFQRESDLLSLGWVSIAVSISSSQRRKIDTTCLSRTVSLQVREKGSELRGDTQRHWRQEAFVYCFEYNQVFLQYFAWYFQHWIQVWSLPPQRMIHSYLHMFPRLWEHHLAPLVWGGECKTSSR